MTRWQSRSQSCCKGLGQPRLWQRPVRMVGPGRSTWLLEICPGSPAICPGPRTARLVRYAEGLDSAPPNRYPSSVTRIPWSSLSEKQYEDMVGVLLCHIHPTSTRIDGSGGDGGRDVQIVGPAGIHAFECKSFTGRMTPARRRQVKRSLLTAKELSPVDWTLIVPVDFTPAELTWFDQLQKIAPFPIRRMGLTWLDARFAERPCIGRYFLEDAANEIVRLAAILTQEKAVLARGARDAVQRVGAIVDQLNALDPYYRFEVTVGHDRRTVTVIPRYVGAERDRPIQAKFDFRFPNDSAGKAAAESLQRAIDFGTGTCVPAQYVESATVDAPAQLGGTYERAAVEIGPSDPTPTTRTFVMTCESPTGSRVAELPLTFELRHHGAHGAIWGAEDRTGTLAASLTFNGRDLTGKVKLAVNAVESYYPHDMWPVMRFLTAVAAPNQIALYSENGEPLTTPTGVPEALLWVEPFMARLVEDLVIIQTASGNIRAVPGVVSLDDVQRAATAAALVRGDSVEGTWSQTVLVVDPAASVEARSRLFGASPAIVLTNEPHKVRYAGVEYSLRKRAQVDYLSARLGGIPRKLGEVVEMDPVPANWAAVGVVPAGAEVVLIPGSTNVARLTLVSGPEAEREALDSHESEA